MNFAYPLRLWDTLWDTLCDMRARIHVRERAVTSLLFRTQGVVILFLFRCSAYSFITSFPASQNCSQWTKVCLMECAQRRTIAIITNPHRPPKLYHHRTLLLKRHRCNRIRAYLVAIPSLRRSQRRYALPSAGQHVLSDCDT